jgi:site-specific DNA-cytosine methylase
VGTDCSGLEAPLLALRRLGFSNINHKFSSEIDDKVRAVLSANFHPEVLYRDIRDRDPHSTAEVDLYVAGFPCQPFSSSGSRHGFLDPDGRGTVFRHIYGYIRAKEPPHLYWRTCPDYSLCKVEHASTTSLVPYGACEFTMCIGMC